MTQARLISLSLQCLMCILSFSEFLSCIDNVDLAHQWPFHHYLGGIFENEANLNMEIEKGQSAGT